MSASLPLSQALVGDDGIFCKDKERWRKRVVDVLGDILFFLVVVGNERCEN